MEKYQLQNLDCADCAAKIEDRLRKTEGVRFVMLNFATGTLAIEADQPALVRQAIHEIEPEVKLVTARPEGASEAGEESGAISRKELWRIGVATVLFLIGLVFNDALHRTPFALGEYAVLIPAYLLSGWTVLSGAVRKASKGQLFDEHFLMTVATVGAILIHEIPEAVGVMIFYMIGENLQELSVRRSRRSIRALLEVRPEYANLKYDGQLKQAPPEAVKVGQEIVVRPGERVPLDGVVLDGDSWLDTSPLTGESRPVEVHPGDSALAGTINQRGVLTMRVTRPFSESSVARILDLVENASQRKATTEKFISQFARVYSPVVTAIAAGIAILPPLLLTGAAWSEWIHRALVVLVISCPCALVVSIPLGYFGGVGAASRRGILVKGSNFLDVLAGVKTVVFDKTGTLTQGAFRVTEVRPANGYPENALLRLAAVAEAHSLHPIGQSIREAYRQAGGDLSRELEGVRYEEEAGYGVQARVNGTLIQAGSDSLMHRLGIPHIECQGAGTTVHVVMDGQYAGYLTVADELKPDAESAITALRRLGIAKLVMLTGDNEQAAGEVAKQLRLDAYQAGMLPEIKLEALEGLMAAERGSGKVAFVGDGINDAPVIARADVGIAMGGMGSQAAIESADVVVMTDAPSKIAEAIEIGRRTRQIVWQNILLAMAIKVAFIALGVGGAASMWEAVFADMGVALLAILNASRILR